MNPFLSYPITQIQWPPPEGAEAGPWCRIPIGTGIQFRQEKPGFLHAYIQSLVEEVSVFTEIINLLSDDFHVSFEFVEKPILRPNGKRTLIV